MKQNERLLVYAVTAFLALILVIAIVFGDNPTTPARPSATGGTSLNDILNGAGTTPDADPEIAASDAVGEEQVVSVTGINGPAATKVEQPLRIKAPSAESQVMQKIGPYTLEHGYRSAYRRVEVKPNDTWQKIAKRWCLDAGYADEIQCCNESTTDLRAGQKLLVPLAASDEQLLAELAAVAKPKLLVGGQDAAAAPRPATGAPLPASSSLPNFATPRIERSAETAAAATPAAPPGGAPVAAPAQGGFVIYTVKSGDMLERILRKRFGQGHFRARKVVQQLNPGLDVDRLRPGQTIKLPATAE